MHVLINVNEFRELFCNLKARLTHNTEYVSALILYLESSVLCALALFGLQNERNKIKILVRVFLCAYS